VLRVEYVAPGLSCTLAAEGAELRVWRAEPGGVLELPLGLWRALPSAAQAAALERAALEAAAFQLPAVVGTPWPGATTRTLTVSDGARSHTTVMHVRSGLPELLHLLEAEIWRSCSALERSPVATLRADTAAPPTLAAGAALAVAVRLYRRGEALTLALAPAATLLVTQGSRTVLREAVTLVADAAPAARTWQSYTVAGQGLGPRASGDCEVSVLMTGALRLEEAGYDATLVAAPALVRLLG